MTDEERMTEWSRPGRRDGSAAAKTYPDACGARIGLEIRAFLLQGSPQQPEQPSCDREEIQDVEPRSSP